MGSPVGSAGKPAVTVRGAHREGPRTDPATGSETGSEADREAQREADREFGRLEERERIAREVHDGLVQNLAAATMLLRAAEYAAGPEDRLTERLGVLYETVLLALDQAQDLTYGAAYAQLSRGGLVAAVRQYATLAGRTMDCLVELDAVFRRPGTPPVIRLEVSGAVLPLPLPAESAVLRAVGEAMSNALRHAGAGELLVRLDYLTDRLVALVQDDGIGLGAGIGPGSAAEPARTGGLGLTGAERLVRQAGGVLTVESAPGRGVRVRVEVPGPGAAPC